MKFLYPEFLWALGVLVIPVLIHLFNLRRYKKQPFTNVRFLKELQKQTRSTRTLRQYLVLLSRLLALAFLVFAFAQPYIPVGEESNHKEGNVVIIYLDNSFSMEAESERGPSIEVAKIRADEIIKTYKETDRFCILTNDFTASTRLVNQDQALMQVNEVEAGPESRDIEDITRRVTSILAGADHDRKANVFLLSDFQFIRQNESFVLSDTTSSYYLLPIRARVVRNVSIDSIYFADPMVKLNEPVRMEVKLSNHGIEDREGINLSLKVNGELKATTSLDIAGGATAGTGFDFVIKEGGWKQAQLEITDDPVVFDDVFYFSFPVKDKVRILDLYSEEPNKDLGLIFSNDPYYEYVKEKVTSMDYAGISAYDLVAIDHLSSVSSGLVKVLESYVQAGGSVVVFPTEEGLEDLNKLSSAVGASRYEGLAGEPMEVASVNFESELFDNVFEEQRTNWRLPHLKRYYRMKLFPGSEELIQMRNGLPFLSVTSYGKGRYYQYAISMDESFINLADHTIVVLGMLKMSLQSSIRYPLWYTVGEMDPIRVDDQVMPSESGLRLTRGEYSIVPEKIPARNETLIAENGQITEAGNYQLQKEGEVIQNIAFNYNRGESRTDIPDDEGLTTMFSQKNVQILDAIRNNIGQQLKNEELGKRFWTECLLLSLFFILIEILLLRLWPLKVRSIPK